MALTGAIGDNLAGVLVRDNAMKQSEATCTNGSLSSPMTWERSGAMARGDILSGHFAFLQWVRLQHISVLMAMTGQRGINCWCRREKPESLAESLSRKRGATAGTDAAPQSTDAVRGMSVHMVPWGTMGPTWRLKPWRKRQKALYFPLQLCSVPWGPEGGGRIRFNQG